MNIADKQTIFLVSGKAGVGKTTFSIACDGIAKHMGFSSNVLSFAGELKRTARDLGWDGKKDERGRKFLQELGKVVRNYDVDTWARILLYKMIPENLDFVFIDDWRFENEYLYFRRGFEGLWETTNLVTVKIVAPNREILKGTKAALDESEIGLDKFDESLYNYVINNEGSLEDFYKNSLDIMKEIKKELKIW